MISKDTFCAKWKVFYRNLLNFHSEFPAGVLQGHFFNSLLLKYMNYGASGFLAGHEIVHGFIGEGSRHDGHGNPFDWFQNNTRKAYEEMAKCVINQYGNYTDKQSGLKVSFRHN